MVCDRHSKDGEPPLPVHLGLRIYSRTRQSKLIDEMFRLGLSVSYDRVHEIENTMVRSLCTKFDQEGTAAYDNLDHDPSSTTAKEAFHGTGISIFQHPDDQNTGQCRDSAYYKDDGLRKQKANLPEEYSTIKPMMMKNKNPPIPKNSSWKLTEVGPFGEVIKYATKWLESIRQGMMNSPPAMLSWSAYHAMQHNDLAVLKNPSHLCFLSSKKTPIPWP